MPSVSKNQLDNIPHGIERKLRLKMPSVFLSKYMRTLIFMSPCCCIRFILVQVQVFQAILTSFAFADSFSKLLSFLLGSINLFAGVCLRCGTLK